MLIDSNFHDYYDSVQSFGIDKTVVYTRRTKNVVLDRNDKRFSKDIPAPTSETIHLSRWERVELKKFAIGFCGKIYPLMVLEPNSTSSIKESIAFYNAEELKKWLAINNIAVAAGRRWSWRSEFSAYYEKDINNFYKNAEWSKLESIFTEYKTPIFCFGRYYASDIGSSLTIQVSPQLKTWKFAKVKDPATAFQELYMYISGVLGTPCMPMIEIADKYKQQQHGHDDPYSFRRAPTKKRK